MTALACLTLHQPLATLMALKVKTIETRSWPAPKSLIGQRMGIHAAKRRVVDGQRIGAWATWRREPFDWLAPAGEHEITGNEIELPFGAIVATGVLTDCVPIVADPENVRGGLAIATAHGNVHVLTSDSYQRDFEGQAPYGDFRPGRWAWLYENVKPTIERCPRCWGLFGQYQYEVDGAFRPCPTCTGAGHCDPLSAKGRQGVWWWTR